MAFFPKPLVPGAVIGVVSPSSASDMERLYKGKEILEQQGFRVMLHPQNAYENGHLAGTDEQRARALMEMFTDPAIDAILCGRGGNGAIRLLDKLDYAAIAANPKLFIGYSDITVLLHAIHAQCGFVTYQGPMLASFGADHDPRSFCDFISVLGRAGQETALAYKGTQTVRSGEAEGILIGGNMTMLQSILGTPYGWTGQDAILFLEDTDEVLYRLDRMLHHFRYAGKLDNVRAVLVGDLINVPDCETSFQKPGERPYGRDLRQIIADNFQDEIPIAFKLPCGHGRYLTTWPQGARARVKIGMDRVDLVLTSKAE